MQDNVQDRDRNWTPNANDNNRGGTNLDGIDDGRNGNGGNNNFINGDNGNDGNNDTIITMNNRKQPLTASPKHRLETNRGGVLL